MTQLTKELTADHILAFGKKIDEDGNQTIKFQFHPAIQQWLQENGIVPTYSVEEKSNIVEVFGYETDKNISLKEREIYTSPIQVSNLLAKVKITVPLSKHQYKFGFPVFSKTPKLQLTIEEKQKLLDTGIWTQEIFNKNS